MMTCLLARPRLLTLIFAAACLAAVGAAAALGELLGLMACSMCWFQRLCFLFAAGGFALTAAFWPLRSVLFRLGELGLLVGLASAARQSFLIFNPELADGSCGAGLFYYWKIGEYMRFLKSGLVGGSDCAQDQPLLLGVPMPVLSLAAFVLVIAAYAAWKYAQARKQA